MNMCKIAKVLTAFITLTLVTTVFAGNSPRQTSTPKYTDSFSYVVASKNHVLVNKYDKMRDVLDNEFNRICGDTFCEGEYGNIVSIDLICSVVPTTGQIKTCLWTLGGTTQAVNENTGKVEKGHLFECSFSPKMTIQKMVNTITNIDYDLEDSILPGMKESLYDMLTGCL